MKTRLRSITERVVTYGFIAIALGLLVYFIGSVNRTATQEINNKKLEVVQINQKLEEAKIDFAKRREQVAEITKELVDKRQEVKEKFENLLEKESNYTTFIEQVERKAKALDIHIQDSTYQQPSQAMGVAGNYKEFKFELRIRGHYNNVKQFLWETENSLQRLVKISYLEILPPLADAQGNMSMKLTLSTFFVP